MYRNLYSDGDVRPPEELRALCGLCDIKWEYVYGRPGHAWKLWAAADSDYVIVIQSTQYEDWVKVVENLVRGL